MADFRTIPIDFDGMDEGTFYEIQTNKDNATALIAVDLSNPKIHRNDFDSDQFDVDSTTNKITLADNISGLDLSDFDAKAKSQIVVWKDFTTPVDSGIIYINVDIPSNVNVAVLSVHKLEGDKITELQIDYQYDNVTKTFGINTGEYNINGQVVMAFYLEE